MVGRINFHISTPSHLGQDLLNRNCKFPLQHQFHQVRDKKRKGHTFFSLMMMYHVGTLNPNLFYYITRGLYYLPKDLTPTHHEDVPLQRNVDPSLNISLRRNLSLPRK